MDYKFTEVEAKWKLYWAEQGTYKVSNDSHKPKYYVLDMFPYPSGAGLHVGHPLGYIATDIYSRHKRMSGYNVLHPMGFDAFGLPAEQYAIDTGVHPADSTATNIARYKEQLANIGFDYDWDREVQTCDPQYYKWTQWIFLQLFDHYYDLDADSAQPISNLIYTFSKLGSAGANAANSQEEPFTADEWNAMTKQEQADTLMNYRLAYQKIGYVNWCEELGTVLANDEVKDGLSERGGFPVERRAMKQWSLRITAYAERLLNDLDKVEWSDALKAMQRNWIGRSEGAQLFFDLVGSSKKIEIFTTRPDTIYGATYMVLAPEHDLVAEITTAEQKAAVEEYVAYVNTRSERERQSEVKEVTGVWTGAYAINPFSGEQVPVWLGEYVLKDYGTGAIMAVPSDDDRDFAFATKYELPIINVVDKTDYEGAGRHDKVGKLINSGDLNGLEVKEAIEKTLSQIEERGIGVRQVNYRLRDANYSRQRYWGEPFPIKYVDGVATALPVSELPLELPKLDNFKPASGGKSPLARVDEWINQYPDGPLESDTMPGFAGSSWYFLRYMDAGNPEDFANKKVLNYWQDVDLYVGGTEHAVGHLMYSRLWHKFLYDKELVPTVEPYRKLINQGMIQGVIEYLYMQKEKEDGKTVFVSADLVGDDADSYALLPVHVDFVSDYGTPQSHLTVDGIKQFTNWKSDYAGSIFRSADAEYTDGQSTTDIKILTKSEVGKMSKRYFNVVNPDDVVAKYGADCFRMYEMFLGPIEQSKPWDTNGIDGVSKFIRKFWNLYYVDGQLSVTDTEPKPEEMKALHTAIKKVSEDIESFSFNTAVSAFMICVNELRSLKCNNRTVLEPLARLIAPFAPFMAEELYHALGGNGSVHHAEYPKFEEKHLKEDSVEYPICINGKKKDLVKLSADLDQAGIEKEVMAMEKVQTLVGDKTIRKVIVVPGRMVNIVVG